MAATTTEMSEIVTMVPTSCGIDELDSIMESAATEIKKGVTPSTNVQPRPEPKKISRRDFYLCDSDCPTDEEDEEDANEEPNEAEPAIDVVDTIETAEEIQKVPPTSETTKPPTTAEPTTHKTATTAAAPPTGATITLGFNKLTTMPAPPPPDPNNPMEKHRAEILGVLMSYKFIIGSFNFHAIPRSTGGYKKEDVHHSGRGFGWTDPKLNNRRFLLTDNAYYVLCGQNSDCIVLDIDDPKNPKCTEVMKLADECCVFKVRTLKGIHYYFKFDPLLGSNKWDANKLGFPADLLGNGSAANAPPTRYYHYGLNKWVYYGIEKTTKHSPNGTRKLGYMSDQLRNYLIDALNSNGANLSNDDDATASKEGTATAAKNTDTPTVPAKKPRGRPPKSHPAPTREPDKCDLTQVDLREMFYALKKSRFEEYATRETSAFLLKNLGYHDPTFYLEICEKMFSRYDRAECVNFYEGVTVRDIAKPVTIATLWAWLGMDAPDVAEAIRLRTEIRKLEPLDPKMIAPGKFFVPGYMMELIKKNVADVGHKLMDPLIFQETTSFKYFNHFHGLSATSSKIYKLHTSKGVKGVKGSEYFPNMYIPKWKKVETSIDGQKCTRYVKQDDIRSHIPYITMWKACPNLTAFSELVFVPDLERFRTDPEYVGTYNTFDGFPYESPPEGWTYDETILTPFLEHIKFLCQETATTEYFLNWVAHIIQIPETKTGSAIIFHSDECGAGKNVITEVISALIGKYSKKIGKISEFTATFNEAWRGKLLGCADEIVNTKSELNSIYDAVTRSEIVIEAKYGEQDEPTDLMNFIFTSNREHAFPICASERRFMVITCPDVQMPPGEGKRLVDNTKNKNYMYNLHHYFKNRDISNYEPRRLVTTQHKRQLMLLDLPACVAMIYREPEYFAGHTITTRDLISRARAYALNNKLPRQFTDDRASKDLKKYFSIFATKKKNGSKWTEPRVASYTFMDSDFVRATWNINDKTFKNWCSDNNNDGKKSDKDMEHEYICSLIFKSVEDEIAKR